jgi:hypothetical protein
MNGETIIFIGFVIAATWGRFAVRVAVQEIRIRWRHYR